MKNQMQSVVLDAPSAKLALCYVRHSVGDYKQALDRQQLLIQEELDKRGWQAEWFIDDVHSGSTEARPEWQRLQARMDDESIAAVVVYDLSRIGRKHSVVAGFIEDCYQRGIELVLITPQLNNLPLL